MPPVTPNDAFPVLILISLEVPLRAKRILTIGLPEVLPKSISLAHVLLLAGPKFTWEIMEIPLLKLLKPVFARVR